VEWTIDATDSGPLKVTVEAWAHNAGQDQRTITIKKQRALIREKPFWQNNPLFFQYFSFHSNRKFK
jgi:hypothetical protein